MDRKDGREKHRLAGSQKTAQMTTVQRPWYLVMSAPIQWVAGQSIRHTQVIVIRSKHGVLSKWLLRLLPAIPRLWSRVQFTLKRGAVPMAASLIVPTVLAFVGLLTVPLQR